VTVSLVIVCADGADPDAVARHALDVGAWSRVGPETWALTVDESPESRRRVAARERQRRHRERDNGVTPERDARDNGVTNERDASRWTAEKSWSESGRDRGVTGETPLGGFPPVTAPPGHADVTSVTRDARDARDAPSTRDTAARRYHAAGALADTSPLDDLERERARRGLAGARAALDRD
jgi:hypothetical protein